MNFEEGLKSMLRDVDGSQAAVLMGFDGIPVAESKTDGAEGVSQDILVEYSRLLLDMIKIGQSSNLGPVSELTVAMGTRRLLFRVVSENYFVVLATSSEANLGKSRYILRRTAPIIEAAL
ncbi:MAG TPA: hypothetical protein VI895_00710 [Bdellovibrionota bacterium]|nr:hypothetical protein [Bdellovibrionota bacterium]